MKNKITFFFTVIVVFCTSVTGHSQNSNYEIANWEGFRTSAVTFTFDDGCPNQFTAALPLFDARGYKATFFPTPAMNNPNWANLKKMADNGHEIGSHSVTHPPKNVVMDENELKNSQSTINQNIPGHKCNTVAYPNCDVPNTTTAAKYYIGGRDCEGRVEVLPSSGFDYFRISSIICGNQGS